MARLAQGDTDKALWLTLAQSWVRLAEHAARAQAGREQSLKDGEKTPNARSV
jgi:hypothetical protein